MAQFAAAFYTSRPWRRTAHAYLDHVSGLCERCLSRGLIVPAVEVHHKVRLSPENLRDPSVALNWANLEALCKDCHMKEHERPTAWRIDWTGHIPQGEGGPAADGGG